MSISAMLTLNLERKDNKRISVIELVDTLISGKWRVQDRRKISYLPVGDKDEFDWQDDEITIDELLDIVEEKEKRGEIIGFLMFWDVTNIGVHVLIHSELELTFGLDINRKTINNLKGISITDVNWYLERIVGLLKTNDYNIGEFSFEQY